MRTTIKWTAKVKRLAMLLVMAFAPLAPSQAQAAAGTCTAAADGNIDGGNAVWGAPAQGCRDLGDNCSGACPDSDDTVTVNGHEVTFNRSMTVVKIDNRIAGGAVVIGSGVAVTTTNTNGGVVLSSATGSYTQRGTLTLNGPNNSIGGTLNGRNIIAGQLLYERKIAAGTGIDCSGSVESVVFDDAVPEAQPGDLIQITSGLARGYTMEIIAGPTEGAPSTVTVDISLRDRRGKCEAVTGGLTDVDGDGMKVRVNSGAGNSDFVTVNDDGYIGKYLWDGASAMYPIVRVDAGIAEDDTFYVLYPRSTGKQLTIGLSVQVDVPACHRT